MKKALIILGLAAALAGVGRAQTSTVQGYCQAGGVKVQTQGVNSTTMVQASYPNCTVTVYQTGTSTLATLYSSGGGAPLGNPFVAPANGQWRFWASTSTCYDVILTGGVPVALPSAQTLTNVCGGGGGGGGGISGQTTGYAVKAATGSTATAPFPIDDSVTTANTVTVHKKLAVNDGLGSGGGFGAAYEGTVPTPGATYDTLYADSISHRWKFNPNNAGTFFVPGVASAAPANDCPKFAANGIDLVDSGGPCGGGGVVGPSFAVQAANSGATAPVTDPNILIDTTLHKFTAPLFFGNAQNFPYVSSANGLNYNANIAYNLPCYQTHIIGDAGGDYPTQNCRNTVFNDLNPGSNYGNGPLTSNQGWNLPVADQLIINEWAAGIAIAHGTTVNNNRAGDYQLQNLQLFSKPAWIEPSGEGTNGVRWVFAEQNPFTGIVATGGGGSGATVLTLTCSANCVTGIGNNSPLLDLSSVQSSTVTYVSGGTGAPAVLTTSLTVTSSITGTLSADVNVPRIVGNTTEKLSSASVTTTLNVTGGSAITTAMVCSVGGSSFETIRPTAVGSLGGGTQSVTAVFYYSHASGSTFYCGGAAGDYLEHTPYVTGNNRYVENVFGSVAPHTLIVGHQTSNGGITGFPFVGATGVSANEYKGGEVVGVINSGTGVPDGGQLTIEANAALWADGDSVEDANNISANYNLAFYGAGGFPINNPYAQRLEALHVWSGLGGGLNPEVNGFETYQNTNAASNYIGVTGGKYIAPWLFNIQGPVLNGLAFEHWPIFGGSTAVGFNANCGGFLLCVASGPVAGAVSSIGGIFTEGDVYASSLTFSATGGLFWGSTDQTVGGYFSLGHLTLKGDENTPQLSVESDFGSGPNITIKDAGDHPAITLQDHSGATLGVLTSDGAGKLSIGTAKGNALGSLDLYSANLGNSATIGPGALAGVSTGFISAAPGQPPFVLAGGSCASSIWRDLTPSSAVSYGCAIPGGALSDDWHFGTYSPGTGGWNDRMDIITATGDVLIATTTDDTVNKLQVNGGMKATNVTDSALTSGDVVQASTGGLLANGPAVNTLCLKDGTNCPMQAYYWNIQGSLFATSTMLGPTHYAAYSGGNESNPFTARLSGAISCTVAPLVQILDLGTDPTTAYGSATVKGTITTGTSDGVYAAVGSAPGVITAGHYYGIAFGSGTCVTPPTFDISATW